MSDTDSPEPGSAPTDPFVPRYREPWVNPAKKGAALAVAVAAAVVLLGVGVLVGLGLGGGHDHGPRHELRMVLRHPGRFGPPHGWTGYRPRGGLGGPGESAPPLQSQPVPVPVPSASHS